MYQVQSVDYPEICVTYTAEQMKEMIKERLQEIVGETNSVKVESLYFGNSSVYINGVYARADYKILFPSAIISVTGD